MHEATEPNCWQLYVVITAHGPSSVTTRAVALEGLNELR
jgi:hypothetical protein